MKEFVKMTKQEVLLFCLMALSSGMIIGIGGTASLAANSLLGLWGKLVGATLFSLGILAIVMYEMKLFTGMVADIPKMGLKNEWQLPVCFLFNSLGVAIVAVIARNSFLGDIVVAQGKATILAKLYAQKWVIKALCSSILCGALITLSVWSVKYAPKKGLSPTVGVMFPIIVFAFCGFDHSVANMLYLCYLGDFSWRILGYVLLTVLGNILGGVILPLISLLKDKAKDKK